MNKCSVESDNGKVFLRSVLAFILSAGIFGCGGGGGGSGPDPATTVTPTTSPIGSLTPTPSPNATDEPLVEIPADGRVVLFDIGEPPLETLTVQQSVEIQSTIQASSTQTLAVGNATETTEVTAEFDVRVSLSTGESEVQVEMIPVLQSYSADSFENTETVPGTWQRTYSLSGSITNGRSNDNEGLIAYNTQFLFSFPGLMLAVPDTAVGEGALWYYAEEVTSGKIQTEVELLDIGSALLTVSLTTFYIPNDESEGVTHTNTLEATYDRGSLLINSGQSIFELGQTYSVSVNGQQTEYQSTDRIVHTITRAAQ